MEKATPRTPVMGDVAKLAGVSHQTVSRVLNDHPHIRPSTRAKVEQAIAQLGYQPNTAARALVRGRTGMVGIVTAAGAFYGPRSAQHAVSVAARAAGFSVTNIELDEITSETLAAAVEDLARVGVEGLVVVAGHDAAVDVARRRQGTLPVVVVEGDLTRAAMSAGVDQVAGAVAATEHLLRLGHRRIAHISGPLDWSEARARLDGWRLAMTRAGLPAADLLPGDWSPASGYAAGQRLADDAGVTAVFAGNDQMALGALRALREAGLRVPEDVSLVGFDDIPEAAYLSPPLTTVHQDFTTVGRQAIAVLTAVLRGDEPPTGGLLPAPLVVRGSTATARTEA
ncbi:LacI family DNA-binding transcriptional regulator [Humibacillus xanthopallidus]|uniref:LacI family transcriptional regulator n=1 Tax=Humibacillus xanthopallidus TaxID=412689 RepID=A0A543HZU4_9MICO|nr:LacI family DNA-binding transcriptional regulator [Humibacillus xanthopallidus]TQM63765.1 LacI family transcriptional regulator [Humibacillus xanthopallidus]